ncbi:MAG TPA: hypothetical protein PLY77_09660 [Plasticicumulans sp.]|nr:hypothetical protein [Plasticicumulans sp.]HMW43144.1 hypothetical protein [Plasticicumulans sp.]HNJ08206.1 hypothetical protein [Plasticicumulans sp.]
MSDTNCQHAAAPCPPLALTGLTGSHPLGALAAFGLLRWSAEIPALRGARLHWELQDDWIAVLTPPAPLDADALCRLLLDAHVANQWPHLDSDELEMPAEDFRERCLTHLETSNIQDRFTIDFDAAIGCDAIIGKNGNIKTTLLNMTSGNQSFLDKLKSLKKSLIPINRKKHRQEPSRLICSLKEAMFGPWTYSDDEHPLGWDPTMERDHAFRAQAPTNDDKYRSVRFAIWLAHLSLPVLPCIPSGRHLHTMSFAPERYKPPYRFRWPIWQTPIALDSLSALLSSPELTGEDKDVSNLYQRGVSAVYESSRQWRNKGLAIFKHPLLISPAAPQVRRSAPAGPLVF